MYTGVIGAFGLGERTSSRGFFRRDEATPRTIAYLGEDDGPVETGAPDAIAAIHNIYHYCQEKGVEVLFFRSPTDGWTRNEAKTVKEFMEMNGYAYMEMNDYLEEIGIDGETDFYNEGHLNISGANKSTDFLARYLRENYGDILGASASAGAL